MRSIQFKVDGNLPPKKAGGKSMWGKKPGTEAQRIIALRKKALEDLKTKPDYIDGEPYFKDTEVVRLTLEIHVGIPEWDTLDAGNRRKALKGSGDLDNFITGVCDGLMAAHTNLLTAEAWHSDFNCESVEIHPSKPMAYKDDSQIMEIRATKVVIDSSLEDACWYKVKIEEWPPEWT